MAFIEWNDGLKLGIAEIDKQHHRLVDLINQLDDALQSQQADAALGDIVKGLLDYTKTHFAYEETLLSSNNYPAFPGHRQEHNALAEKVGFLRGMYQDGKAPPAEMVMGFLKSWLQEHILEVDKEYVAFLQSHGIT